MESMKNKILIATAFCLCFLWSCDENKKDKVNKTDKETIIIDSNSQIENNSEENTANDTTEADSVNRKQKKKIVIPDSYDYESVYQFQYEHYIDKAYDRNTYEKHYKPYTYQSKHLDSLIEIYEKKKKEIENKEKSE